MFPVELVDRVTFDLRREDRSVDVGRTSSTQNRELDAVGNWMPQGNGCSTVGACRGHDCA